VLGLMATTLLVVGRGVPPVTAPAALVLLAAVAAVLGLVAIPLHLRERWERVAASLALVAVALILGGLALSVAGRPLDVWHWLALLTLVLVLAGASALREGRRPPRRPWRVPGGAWLLAAVAAGQVVLAAGIGVAGALTAPQPPFTQLTLSRAASSEVVIRLENRERSDETYRVVALIEGEEVARWPAVTLAQGERWTGRLSLPASWQSVSAVVYRPSEATTPYRQTILWNRPLP
jgi:hypothetical protein